MVDTDEATPLAIGERVRVYRVHSAAPIWLRDPATGKTVLSHAEVETGVISEVISATYYRVTIMYDGRPMYYDTGRYWIRRLDEYPPTRRGQR